MAHLPTRRGGVIKKLLLTLAIIFALVVLLVGYEAVLAVTSKPAITQNYSQQIHDRSLERQRAHFGEGLNQYPRFEEHMVELQKANQWLHEYNQALPGEFKQTPHGYVSLDMIYTPTVKGTADEYAQAQRHALAMLEHWRDLGVFDRTADLATLERVAVPPVEHSILETLLPHLGLSRQIARAQAARMHLAAQEGDDDQRATAFKESMALGRITADQGSLIAWLVGEAIDGLALDRLMKDQLLFPINTEQRLVDIDAIIERERSDVYPSLEHAMQNETLSALDSVQRVHTKSGRLIPVALAKLGDPTADIGSNIITPFGDSALSNITARAFYDRDETSAWIERAYELTGIASRAMGADALTADGELERFVAGQTWDNVVGGILVINGTRIIRTDRLCRINAAGARVVIAIERYRLRHDGAIPQALDDLGDLLPESLRTDPFTGQPWDYQPTPMTTRADGEPLEPNDTVWPYTLASRPLPNTPTPDRPSEHDPYAGILITTPVEGNSFDEPFTEEDDDN